jgi:hypothetical protein
MGRLGPNRQNSTSRELAPLIEIARLLARQAARECAELGRGADLPPQVAPIGEGSQK